LRALHGRAVARLEPQAAAGLVPRGRRAHARGRPRAPLPAVPAVSMIPIIDRYVLRFFWSSYAICFAVLIILFMLGQAFDDLDRFFGPDVVWWRELGRHFAGQLPLIFDRFGPFITLAGAMFAAARL